MNVGNDVLLSVEILIDAFLFEVPLTVLSADVVFASRTSPSTITPRYCRRISSRIFQNNNNEAYFFKRRRHIRITGVPIENDDESKREKKKKIRFSRVRSTYDFLFRTHPTTIYCVDLLFRDSSGRKKRDQYACSKTRVDATTVNRVFQVDPKISAIAKHQNYILKTQRPSFSPTSRLMLKLFQRPSHFS